MDRKCVKTRFYLFQCGFICFCSSFSAGFFFLVGLFFKWVSFSSRFFFFLKLFSKKKFSRVFFFYQFLFFWRKMCFFKCFFFVNVFFFWFSFSIVHRFFFFFSSFFFSTVFFVFSCVFKCFSMLFFLQRSNSFFLFQHTLLKSFCAWPDGSDVHERLVTQYCQPQKHSTMLLCTSKKKLWRRNSGNIILHWPLENPQHSVAPTDSCTLEKNDLTGDHQKPAVCFKVTGATTAVSPHSEPMKAQHWSQHCTQRGRGSFKEDTNWSKKKRKLHNAQILGSCVK